MAVRQWVKRTQNLGITSTAMGVRSTIKDTNIYGSVYGIDNKLSYESQSENGPGGSIATGAYGMLNKVDSSLTSMVFGTPATRVTNAFGNVNEGIERRVPVRSLGAKYISIPDDFGYTDHLSEIMEDCFRRSTAAPYLHLERQRIGLYKTFLYLWDGQYVKRYRRCGQ